jgi:hypothetical protein
MKLSSLLLTIYFLLSLISVLLLSLSNQKYKNIPDRSAIFEGPKWEKTNTKSTADHIQFIYALVTPSTGPPDGCCSDVAELDKLAQAHMKENNQSHYGNRIWYWKSTPADKNEYVLLIWRNSKRNEYDWIAVKDTPAFWYAIRKGGKRYLVLNGHQIVCGWYTNKKYLEIRVNNPSNVMGWTAFDFWYSFVEDEIKPSRDQIGPVAWLSDLVDNTCHNEAD